MEKIDEVSAVEKEETTPLIDFAKTEEKDRFSEDAKKVRANILQQFELKLFEFILGIAFLILTTKTGILGTFLFMAALFYLIPDGLIKSIVYLIRLRHYEDYVQSKDYRLTEGYLTTVMTIIREKGVFTAGRGSRDN